MRSKVRGTLDQLENVLLEGGSEARDLMNLLSILRGPDNRDIGTKEKVTMPLRSMIFPRLYEHTKNRTGFQQGCFPIRDKNGWGMREPGDMERSLISEA